MRRTLLLTSLLGVALLSEWSTRRLESAERALTSVEFVNYAYICMAPLPHDTESHHFVIIKIPPYVGDSPSKYEFFVDGEATCPPYPMMYVPQHRVSSAFYYGAK